MPAAAITKATTRTSFRNIFSRILSDSIWSIGDDVWAWLRKFLSGILGAGASGSGAGRYRASPAWEKPVYSFSFAWTKNPFWRARIFTSAPRLVTGSFSFRPFTADIFSNRASPRPASSSSFTPAGMGANRSAWGTRRNNSGTNAANRGTTANPAPPWQAELWSAAHSYSWARPTPARAAQTNGLAAAARSMAARIVPEMSAPPPHMHAPRRAQAAAASHDLSYWKPLLFSLMMFSSGLMFMSNNNYNAFRNFNPLSPIAQEFSQAVHEIMPGSLPTGQPAPARAPLFEAKFVPDNSIGTAKVQLVTPPTLAPAPTAAVQHSFQYAHDTGFLGAVNYVCAQKENEEEKRTSCAERMLAIAQVESGMGQNVVSRKSTARGSIQMLSGTFIDLEERYGANNLPIIAGYIDSLGPENPKAVRLRSDLKTLETALGTMHKGHLPFGEQAKILRLRLDPIFELPLAADWLKTQDSLYSFNFSWFGWFAGNATKPVLTAYADPARRNEPVRSILTQVISPRLANEVLISNGDNPQTTVKSFVERREEPFARLTGQYHQLLTQPSYTYTQVASLR